MNEDNQALLPFLENFSLILEYMPLKVSRTREVPVNFIIKTNLSAIVSLI